MTTVSEKHSAFSLYARLLRYGGKRLWLSGFCTLISGFSTFLVFSTIGVLLQRILEVIEGADVSSLLHSSIVYICFVLVFSMLSSFAQLGVHASEQAIRSDLRCDILKKWMAARECNVDSWHTSDVLLRINDDLKECTSLVGRYMDMWVMNPILSGLFSLFVVFTIEYRIGLFCLLCSLLNLSVSKVAVARSRSLRTERQEHQKKASKQLSDLIDGAVELRIYRLASGLIGRIDTTLSQIQTANSRLDVLRAVRVSVYNFIADFINIIGLILLGAYLSQKQILPFSQVMIAIPLSDQISQMVMGFSNLYGEVIQRDVNLRRIFEVLDIPEEPRKCITALGRPSEKLSESVPEIFFSNVTFGYKDKPVLKDISFKILKGQRVALVGVSGGGKSTVFSMLLGLYKAEQGEILVRGHLLCSDTDLTDWRKQFAYVPQDYLLLDMSVRDNIAMGFPDKEADEGALLRAMDAARASQFVQELPGGMEYSVGEGGRRLSGGQRQRVCIARAILRDAPILLLDEATSAIDNHNEQELERELMMLGENRTCITVTHRLTNMEGYDRIFVLNEGRIVEAGTHHELMERGEEYTSLYLTMHHV